jgi:hypothetical protein
VNLGPRKVIWIEANESRCMMTGGGPLPVFKGEFVMVVAGKSLEDCQRLFCDMMRTRGEFAKDE